MSNIPKAASNVCHWTSICIIVSVMSRNELETYQKNILLYPVTRQSSSTRISPEGSEGNIKDIFNTWIQV